MSNRVFLPYLALKGSSDKNGFSPLYLLVRPISNGEEPLRQRVECLVYRKEEDVWHNQRYGQEGLPLAGYLFRLLVINHSSTYWICVTAQVEKFRI